MVSALLVNARRHAPGSPVLLPADAGEGEVHVYVEDRGPGVPLDQRQTVFERGERGDARCAGSGRGLYTARRLVVTGASDPLRLGTCREIGAAGVLSKSRPLEGVLAAVPAAVLAAGEG